MELPNLGKRCFQDECRQLDFLPLQCEFCGDVFCSDHLNLHVQNCTKFRFLSENPLKKINTVYVCSEEGCEMHSVIALTCSKCLKHYCVKHRHVGECSKKSLQEIHQEKEKYVVPLRQFREAKALVDEQLQSTLTEAKKKTKSRETAIKLQLMKLKNKATGLKSIPTANRVYFKVVVHKEALKVVPVFVSNSWSLGRVIDAVAEECNMQNHNNKSGALKLRLFKQDDLRVVSSDLTESLSSLLESKKVVNGEDLIVEYVKEECEILD